MFAKRPSNTSKRPINVSVNSDLLEAAKVLHINCSQALEQRLAELVHAAQAQAWLYENRAALDDYNRRIEREGVFSNGLRRF